MKFFTAQSAGSAFFLAMTTGSLIGGFNGMAAIFSWWKTRRLLLASRLMPSPIETALRIDSTRAVRIMFGLIPQDFKLSIHRW